MMPLAHMYKRRQEHLMNQCSGIKHKCLEGILCFALLVDLLFHQ